MRGDPLDSHFIQCRTHLPRTRQEHPKRSLKFCEADQWQRLTPVQGPSLDTPAGLREALRKHRSIVCGLEQCDVPGHLGGESLDEGKGIARAIRTDDRRIKPQCFQHLSEDLCRALAHGRPSEPGGLRHEHLTCHRLLLQGLSTGRAGGRKPPGFVVTREKSGAQRSSPGLRNKSLDRGMNKAGAVLEQRRLASSAKAGIRRP